MGRAQCDPIIAHNGGPHQPSRSSGRDRQRRFQCSREQVASHGMEEYHWKVGFKWCDAFEILSYAIQSWNISCSHCSKNPSLLKKRGSRQRFARGGAARDPAVVSRARTPHLWLLWPRQHLQKVTKSRGGPPPAADLSFRTSLSELSSQVWRFYETIYTQGYYLEIVNSIPVWLLQSL